MSSAIPRQSITGALFLLPVLLVGCAGASEDGASPASPVAPSASTSSSTQVRVQGGIAELRGSCPNLSFRIGAERIMTNGNTQFRRIACGDIRNGTSIEIDGLRQANGIVLVREVELDVELEDTPPPAGTQIDVEGIITGLTGSCPNLTFNIGSTRVRTSGTTEFDRIPCSFLENGMDVEVEGFVQPNGAILAREVQPDEATIDGTLMNLNGACPERSFTVNGQRARTLLTTRFDDIACATLQAGMQVELRGVRRADGSLLATRVRPLENRREGAEVRVEGSLSGLAGTCPARSFRVAGELIATHAGTRFDDVTCGGLQDGMQLEVRGFRLANGSILADRVKRED